MDDASQGWTVAAREAFKAAAEVPGTRNVVLTSSKLLSALGKLILFSLNRHVAPHDVCSVWMEGRKKDHLAELQASYPPGVDFLVIGDGKEEHAAALELGMPFFEITRGSCAKAAADLGRLQRQLVGSSQPARQWGRQPAPRRTGRPARPAWQ